MTEKEFIDALKVAYELGAKASLAVNVSSRGMSQTLVARERAALNRLMRKYFHRPMTDEEYKPFEE
jgi:hypothetical protein